MAGNETSFRVGHRKRLQQKFLGGYKLSDDEILELFLTYAIPRCDIKPYVHDLRKTFGNIHHILTTPIEDLMKVRGIKENSVALIKIVHEIMMRGYKSSLDDTPIFHDYNRLLDYCRLKLLNKSVEEFHVFYLDADYKLLKEELHNTGTESEAPVYPKEIVKRALTLSARSVVLLHNHPSMTKPFSHDDITTTEIIKAKLAEFDIELYDHLLVAGGIVYSAKEKRLIN